METSQSESNKHLYVVVIKDIHTYIKNIQYVKETGIKGNRLVGHFIVGSSLKKTNACKLSYTVGYILYEENKFGNCFAHQGNDMAQDVLLPK